ncbi:unnamed protein product [Meganyctiphanes norvegica]|uniref:Ras-associating domain-containing protein n=1 Tax=Meganyctiphanes norvegica TaxID=48144 RepID=A0AAV2QY84_MEGNR
MLKYVQVSPYRSGSSAATTPVLGSVAERASSLSLTTVTPHHNPQLSSASSSCTSSSTCTYCSSSVDDSSCSTGEGRINGVDNVSLNSSYSSSMASLGQLGSRASSSVSLLPSPAKTMVRVWVRCLLQEMEYKTVCITNVTTCRQLVNSLLSKFKMKHRDPNLFFLTMEVTVRKTGVPVRTNLTLEDSARPAELLSCHPHGDSRLTLKMRPGGLMRVYDGALVAGSRYKSLLVSEKTTSDELIQLILLCNNIKNNIENYSLLMVHHNDGREHKLHHNDHPLVMMGKWTKSEHARLLIRKNVAHSQAQITQISTLRKINKNELPLRDTKIYQLESFKNFKTNSSNIFSSGNDIDHDIFSAKDTCLSTSCSPVQIRRTNGTCTTITISSNGASKVTMKSPFLKKNYKNKSLKSVQNKNKNFLDQSEDIEKVSRQSSENFNSEDKSSKPCWSLSNMELLETPIDGEDDTDVLNNTPTRRAHSYNDYENYFYI